MKLVLLVIVAFFSWWIISFVFGIYGFYQICLNIGNYLDTADLQEAVICLLWEKENKLEKFLNSQIDAITVGYRESQYTDI